jgi:Bacterial Ig-like domain (group 3)
MLKHPTTSRTRVLVVTAALATAGLPLLAGGPAQAASVPLTYSCTNTFDANTYAFSAVVDTNAPATLGSGMTTPITVTSDVTIPETLVSTLYGAGVRTVEGTSQATGTVDDAGRVSTLAIPTTGVPATGTMHVIGTGAGGTITGGAVGSSILLGAASFTATLTPKDAAGNVVVIPGTTTFTCTLNPPTGQNLLVDTVNVVQTTTTTTLTVDSPVEYGGVVTARADVTQGGSNAKPSGSVAFTYAGKTVTVAVKGGKAQTDLAPALTMGANQVTAVFTPTDKDKSPSQTTAAFTVVRGTTTTTASAAVREARHRLVGKALVTSENATDVAGKVKLTLKRNGTKIRSAIVDLNAKDKAKKVFANIRKPGTYLVVAKYLGSDTLKRSTGRVKLNIL